MSVVPYAVFSLRGLTREYTRCQSAMQDLAANLSGIQSMLGASDRALERIDGILARAIDRGQISTALHQRIDAVIDSGDLTAMEREYQLLRHAWEQQQFRDILEPPLRS
ncbi:MAG: hypothetical protein P4M00_25250 [Azospirillaceae bacterium]|nr:hypothetical protein [Azospirillaceae bacterium]